MGENIDHLILENFQRGEEPAFNALFKEFYPRLSFFACRLIDHKEEAEDIAIQTFTKLFSRHQQFDSLPAIRAFLFTAARNHCLDYLRAQKRLKEKQKELMQYLQPDEHLETEQIFAETIKKIHAVIEGLPAECRKIFKMTFMEGMKPADVAEQMQLSVDTVYSQRRRALQLLRLSLSDQQLIIAFLLLGLPFALATGEGWHLINSSC